MLFRSHLAEGLAEHVGDTEVVAHFSNQDARLMVSTCRPSHLCRLGDGEPSMQVPIALVEPTCLNDHHVRAGIPLAYTLNEAYVINELREG